MKYFIVSFVHCILFSKIRHSDFLWYFLQNIQGIHKPIFGNIVILFKYTLVMNSVTLTCIHCVIIQLNMSIFPKKDSVQK